MTKTSSIEPPLGLFGRLRRLCLFEVHHPDGQLKSIEWLQKHRKKLPQSLWGAERVTPIKIGFRHIETSNEYALRTPDELKFLDNLKAVRRRSESTMAATQYD